MISPNKMGSFCISVFSVILLSISFPALAVDQCDTTQQCKDKFGSRATDCKNSKSNDSVCMCGTKACTTASSKPASSKATSSKAAVSSVPSGGGGVVQPPASCSNIGNSIPNNIRIHTILDKSVERPDFPDFAKWYTESGNVQRFQLKNGDQNTTSSILRPRVEAYSPPPQWKRAGRNDWHEFSANYYLAGWDEGQRYAVFQIKTNDASNFIIQVLIDKDGSLEIARRSKGTVDIDSNVLRKPFHLRVRSTGYKFEVYLNCKLVLAEDHPQPELEDNATAYGWRWGLYRQKTDNDRQIGTTTLYVTGPKFN